MALTSQHKMGIAALIMGGSILLSRLMGLVRDKVISWQFGTGGDADIYFAAFVVPDFLNYLLAGGYLSITLIPLLSRCFEEEENDAWNFFGAVFCWASLSIGILTLLAWLFAPQLSAWVAPGFTAEQHIRLTSFLRVVLPAQVFFLPGACLSALLYIRRQFFVPALMPLVYNGFILGLGVVMPWLGLADGMGGFCWGVLAGAAFGAFFLPLLTVRKGAFYFRPRLRHPLLKKFLLMALPLMLGQSVVVLDEQFVRIFGSMAGDGAVSLLNYARRIMMVPVGVVAQAAGVASFPFLAMLAIRGEVREFTHTVNSALRNSLIVVIPVTIWLMASSGPVLGFLFEGGSFGPAETTAATPLLQAMLLAVPFWSLQQVIGRAFYAKGDTLTPALVGTATTILALPAYVMLTPLLGALGVAMVTSLSILLYALALMLTARLRWDNTPFTGLLNVTWRSFLLALPGGTLVWLATIFAPPLLAGLPILAGQFLLITLSGLMYLTLYLLLAKCWAPDFLAVLRAPLRRRSKQS